jgi:hypothetical protein
VALADFTILIEHEALGQDREVRVIVYRTVAAMRAAATRYDNRTGHRGANADTLGICHRFERVSTDTDESDSLVAIVRLALPHVGVGMISHELAHAAVWLLELAGRPIVTDDDEPFCWILGELVRQTVNAMNDRGVFA